MLQEAIEELRNIDVYRVFVSEEEESKQNLKVDRVGVLAHTDTKPAIKSGWYKTASEFPEWMKEKLAVLNMLHAEERPAQTIDGVGRRINNNTFWVFYTEDTEE